MIHEALKWAVEHTIEATHLTASTEPRRFRGGRPARADDSPEDAVFQFEVLLRALRSPDCARMCARATTTTSRQSQVAHCRWHRRRGDPAPGFRRARRSRPPALPLRPTRPHGRRALSPPAIARAPHRDRDRLTLGGKRRELLGGGIGQRLREHRMSRGNSVSATLRMGSSLVAAFCETVVPAVEGEPTALMGVSAVDLGVPERMWPEAEQVLADVLGPTSLLSGSRSEPAGSTPRRHGRAAAYELRRLGPRSSPCPTA